MLHSRGRCCQDVEIQHDDELWRKILPADVISKVEQLLKAHGSVRDLSMVDLFAGWGGLCRAFRGAGFKSRAYDRHA